ncbi:class I poly(R)-hydroxyalkanoic acid synthase [Paracoccus pacificus]|uniref:Class I poly(R)-hydroxyalkanoic acid synthase n=1 Tax=Paracoccus pacificus TaxID=1463598 RepID=A0ABW4R5W3_9RHOB
MASDDKEKTSHGRRAAPDKAPDGAATPKTRRRAASGAAGAGKAAGDRAKAPGAKTAGTKAAGTRTARAKAANAKTGAIAASAKTTGAKTTGAKTTGAKTGVKTPAPAEPPTATPTTDTGAPGKPATKPPAKKTARQAATKTDRARVVRSEQRSDTRTDKRPVRKTRKPAASTVTETATERVAPEKSVAEGAAPAPKRAARPKSAAKPKAAEKTAAAGKPSQTAPVTPATEKTVTPEAPKIPEVPAPDEVSSERIALTEAMAQNLERIEALGQRLMAALARKRPLNPGVEGPGQDLYLRAGAAVWKQWTEQPGRMIEQQVKFWGETLKHYADAQNALSRGKIAAPPDDGPQDRRFKNPLWESHPFFNFVKRQYQINARAMEDAAAGLDVDSEIDRRRINWLTRQIVDMLAPTNFLATNPDALERAIETEGESLVKGLENLVRDVEYNDGELVVSLADRQAFRVGENIGTASGEVVHRAPLWELIQYTPTTPQVHALPLVIFPPWINKFYILDLKPQNSLIRWTVDQGFTLFVVSWRNPGTDMAEVSLDDYVTAYLDIMSKVLELTGQQKLNAVGYCIAGTTLALTLALMAKRGDDRVNSATFFTTLTDFSDQGEFTAFLQDDFVDGIEAEVERSGILPSALMSRTFSYLRANDLVWGPAIRSYMMGEAPPAFDLLFWNGDGTNLPGRMAMDYLRGLCQQNAFALDGFTVKGQRVRLSDVELPLCAIACETDHIAPWKDSWRGVSMMGSKDRTFVLSQSGHIAGIVNPPSKGKYGHYTSTVGFDSGQGEWLEKARFHPGSWWPMWAEWLAARSGGMVPARDATHGGKSLAAAPGSYVIENPAE